MRIAVGVEYRGSSFKGWQSQRGVRTVQDCIERALGRVADHDLRVVTAGRTDAGVHATGQVIHFDTASNRPMYNWMRGANVNLPADVRVLWAREVAGDFHARFRAIRRSYRYIVYAGASRPAILNDLCAWSPRELDLGAMREAVAALPGRRDFSAFRAAGCQARTPVRTVSSVTLDQSGPWFWLDISADAFLQHMVRNIVGSLFMVGWGDRPPSWLGEVLAARDRTRAGAAAPPNGLYLSEVLYPPEFAIPPANSCVRFW